MNKENLVKEGKELIAKLLLVLQTYKSSGCAERGQKFYNEYSAVSDFFLNIREVLVKNQKGRGLIVQNNLRKYTEDTIDAITYPENFQGVIHSFAQRYPFDRNLYQRVKSVWD